MLSKILFLSCTIFSLSLSMETTQNPTAEDLIAKYKATFPHFVQTLRRSINLGSTVSNIPVISSQAQRYYEKSGGDGNFEDYIQFFDRFFDNKNKETRYELIGKTVKNKQEKKSKKSSSKKKEDKKKTKFKPEKMQPQPGTFGTQEHINTIDFIWKTFQGCEKKTLSNLQTSIHSANVESFKLDPTIKKEDVCKKILEKNNGQYKISNDVYFNQAACILFVIHVFQNECENKK